MSEFMPQFSRDPSPAPWPAASPGLAMFPLKLSLFCVLLVVILPALTGCTATETTQAKHLLPATQQVSRYPDLAADFLAGEAVDPAALERAWLATADFHERVDALAARPADREANIDARLALYAGDLAAHAAKARHADGTVAARHAALADRLFDAILATGDGSSERPWRVSSRGDAIAVVDRLGLETVGGYYQSPADRPLTLRLTVRETAGATSEERVFELSHVFQNYQRQLAHRSAGTPFTPLHLIERFAQRGESEALTSMGVIAREGHSTTGLRTAAERFTEAARSGNQVAEALLAELYMQQAERLEDGRRAQALAEAERGFRRAAATGSSYATYRLGLLAVAAGEPDSGLALLEDAAAAGEAAAMRQLAEYYRDGVHVPADPERALELYRTLHALGDVKGRYSYAYWALREEDGAATDIAALEALRANVDDGHALSVALLGDLYALGAHMPANHPRALQLWRQAALDSDTLGAAHGIARALVRNPPGLADPAFAAELLEQWLTGARGRDNPECTRCWATWAEALVETDRPDEAATVIELALARTRRADNSTGEARLLETTERLDLVANVAGVESGRVSPQARARSGQATPVPLRPQ